MCLGIPGRITEIWDDRGTRMALVDFGGATRTACLAYLPAASVGDYTIVHAGFALTVVDEAAAHRTLATFRELGLLADELGPGQLGPGQLGPGQLGPGQLGPGQLGPVQVGEAGR